MSRALPIRRFIKSTIEQIVTSAIARLAAGVAFGLWVGFKKIVRADRPTAFVVVAVSALLTGDQHFTTSTKRR